MTRIKLADFRLIALFLLSIATIAYEIAVMRTFAVGNWSNFGAMVISIALLGYGLAGTLITFLRKKILARPDDWLATSALSLGPAMAAAHLIAQKIPFNPVLIVSDPLQIWYVALYYAVYAVPFFSGAVFIGIIFVAMSSRVHRLYFINMAGSGIGGFVVLALMYVLPPERLIFPLVGLAFCVAALCSVRLVRGTARIGIDVKILASGTLLSAAAVALLLLYGTITVSEFKPISYARRFPDAREVYHSYGPTGEMRVFESSFFHFAPGLSDTASIDLQKMPERAFLGLYIDGGGPIAVMRALEPSEEAYMDYLPMSAPYLLVDTPDVLVLKLGGGTSVFTALYHGARSVQVVESNPSLVRMLGKVPYFVRMNGGLLSNPRVSVADGEPRAFVSSTDRRFDIVEISLIDSVGLSQTGGYPVEENYTYTAEGIDDYLRSLKPGGVLSITVWNKLSPPRNVPKLLATVTRALEMQGVPNPGNRIFVFDLLLSTATILVKGTDFTPGEVQALLYFCRRMSFEVCYYPGVPVRNRDFDAILAEYAGMFRGAAGMEAAGMEAAGTDGSDSAVDGADAKDIEAAGSVDLTPGDLYHFALQWLLSGRSRDLFKKYIFDIRPATDDRPYYTGYLKPRTVSMFRGRWGEVSEEWGYLMLLGTFVLSILFGLLIIMLPVTLRWRELFRGRGGGVGVVAYYAALGLGYMMAEIFLIQRLVFFLADPIFSNSIVITSMLVISGLGSLYSSGFNENRRKIVRIAAAGITGSILFYLFGLSPLLRLMLGMPLIVKMFSAVVFVAPAAFFLGMPFPTGLSALSENREGLLPWAWGMNGALSVTGAVAARLLSVSFGFTVVLICVIMLYFSAVFFFPSNEKPRGLRRAD